MGPINRGQGPFRAKSWKGTAVGGGTGSQLCRRDLLGIQMSHLWHFWGWSQELYRARGLTRQEDNSQSDRSCYSAEFYLPRSNVNPLHSPSDVPQRTDCPTGCLPTSEGGTHGLSLPGQGSGVTAWIANFIPTLFGRLTTKVSL